MMIKPGITNLDKCVDSRYTLVSMAAKRARMIGKAMHMGITDNDGVKPVTTAVNEIMDGKVGYVRSGRIKSAQVWEEEKFAAIQNMSDYSDVEVDEAYSDEDEEPEAFDENGEADEAGENDEENPEE